MLSNVNTNFVASLLICWHFGNHCCIVGEKFVPGYSKCRTRKSKSCYQNITSSTNTYETLVNFTI